MTQPIRGTVARVLNTREIAINLGTEHGITIGMYFDVMDAGESDILDPNTKEMLGSIERPKIRMKITHIEEKLSVASTYKSECVNVGGTGTKYSAVLKDALSNTSLPLTPPRWVKKYETLEKTEETPAPLDEKDSRVKTGDPVVQVFEADETEQEDTKPS